MGICLRYSLAFIKAQRDIVLKSIDMLEIKLRPLEVNLRLLLWSAFEDYNLISII